MWFVLIALDFELHPSKKNVLPFLEAPDDCWEYADQMDCVGTFILPLKVYLSIFF